MARIIDGTLIASTLEGEIKAGVDAYRDRWNRTPFLAVVLLGSDPASLVYVTRKQQACARVGIGSMVTGQDWTPDSLRAGLLALSRDADVDGILLQLPIPSWYGDPVGYFECIDPAKDVDVFHPLNVGRMMQGSPCPLKPCTPAGIQELIHRSNIPLAGRHLVVINRSVVVGKPLSSLLIQDDDFGNATVTVCHDRTPSAVLRSICLAADIIVVAVGKPGFLTREMVSPWSGVVDVGITRVDGRLVGDLHPDARDGVSWYTRTPGGVGPMTCAMLLRNTLAAAEARATGE